jgi:hypothetical protein
VGLEHVADHLAASAASGPGSTAIADVGDRACPTGDLAVDISFALTKAEADDH